MYKKRIIQASLVCLLLTVSVFVTGCLGGSSTTKAEVNAVLDRLQSGMYYENVNQVLSCYTDPFSFVYQDGREQFRTLADYRYELETSFYDAEYEFYHLFNRHMYGVGLTQANVLCDFHAKAFHRTLGPIEDYCELDFTLVKQFGSWKIARIVEIDIVQGSQKLSVLGLPREPEQAEGLQE